MTFPKSALFVFCVLLASAASGGALAQSDRWDKPIDLKPLLPPMLPPLLPPNSVLTPGAVGGGPSSTYSGPPLYDSTQSLPAPGLRLTIPTR